MKRKFLTVSLALVAALCLCFGLAACGEGGSGGSGGNTGGSQGQPSGGNSPWGGGYGSSQGGGDNHTHIAELFQVDGEEHWKICTICGEEFSFEDHDYNSGSACKICGYSTVYTRGLEYELILGGLDPFTNTYMVTGIGEATDATELVIPSYYEGKPVTAIGDDALYGCSGLTSIVIPDSVTEIGASLYDCNGLESITVGERNPNYSSQGGILYNKDKTELIHVPRAIKGAVTIPDSVTLIGASLYDCSGIESITVGERNPNYSSQGGILYNKDKTELIHAPRAIKGAVTIPDSVTLIVGNAFEGCSELTSVVIPDSVTEIGYGVFQGCSGLTSVVIPDSVTEIGYWAFQGCIGLTNIEIPDSVTEIGYGAFQGCIGLTSIEIPDSVTSIGPHAFEDCSGLTSVVIPDSVTSIRPDAFEDCPIEEATMPTTAISSIPKDNLKKVVLIGGESIEDYAFRYCLRLTSVTIGSGVKTIGEYAFCGCSELTSITIPDSVTSIGISAFVNCSKLTSIEIPDGVTEIGDDAFDGCSELTSITIPDSVTSIGSSAFEGCSGLTSIEIPGGVTEIGERAFFYCIGLTDIQFKGTVAEWQAIEKGSDWNYGIGRNYTVTCTDGTVDKQENVTYFEN